MPKVSQLVQEKLKSLRHHTGPWEIYDPKEKLPWEHKRTKGRKLKNTNVVWFTERRWLLCCRQLGNLYGEIKPWSGFKRVCVSGHCGREMGIPCSGNVLRQGYGCVEIWDMSAAEVVVRLGCSRGKRQETRGLWKCCPGIIHCGCVLEQSRAVMSSSVNQGRSTKDELERCLDRTMEDRASKEDSWAWRKDSQAIFIYGLRDKKREVTLDGALRFWASVAKWVLFPSAKEGKSEVETCLDVSSDVPCSKHEFWSAGDMLRRECSRSSWKYGKEELDGHRDEERHLG